MEKTKKTKGKNKGCLIAIIIFVLAGNIIPAIGGYFSNNIFRRRSTVLQEENVTIQDVEVIEDKEKTKKDENYTYYKLNVTLRNESDKDEKEAYFYIRVQASDEDEFATQVYANDLSDNTVKDTRIFPKGRDVVYPMEVQVSTGCSSIILQSSAGNDRKSVALPE